MSLLFSVGSPPSHAQAIDVAEQARVSREKLVAEIARVDADLLRDKLLQSADNERLAHWYAGEVLVDDQWLTLDEAQQQAANDKQLTAYRKLREQAADRLVDHERLARWCEKHDLKDLAKMHWLHVLQFDQEHRAALSELGLTWHRGRLLTHKEAEQYKQREREWLKQKKAWQMKVKQLRRDLEKGLVEEEMAARQELKAIHEPAAVPALLEKFGEPARDEQKTIARQTELMTVLGGIDAPAAVETLAQFAVESPYQQVRYTALDQLRSKPLETYVPALLAGMAMPIEASVSINNSGNRVVSSYSYSQEKPGGKEYTEDRQEYQTVSNPRYRQRAVPLYRRGGYVAPRTIKGSTSKVPINPGHGRGWVERRISGICSDGRPFTATLRRQEYGAEYLKEVTTPDVEVPGGYSANFAGYKYAEDPALAAKQQAARGRLQQKAFRAQQALEEHNRATVFQNERIASVLSEVTGETLSAFPKSWWNWWSDYLDSHPDVATVGTRQQLNRALLNQESRGLARGTWVWTRQGHRPIEKVMPGDYVLAQEPRTGELAFRVVLAVTAPQERTVSKVEFDESELHCTPGHVVWATGVGWQRVSKLTAGQMLHGATAEAQVGQVDAAFEIDSYDLIVDDFHTFFVGEQGLLVHDATPIGPAQVALPGFSPAAVAEAVKAQ
ncbi:MAG: hypothetical protein GXP24_03555 [Planctomycetes bacterium]|nr:hypothetical protein [Planctomycetota bacterium]